MKGAQVRILVVGKSGCGKSALIRLFIGQDQCHKNHFKFITKHYREDLPIAIYESDDVDATTTNNDHLMAEIKQLVDDHRKPETDLSEEGVHAVWYIFSATRDFHVLQDGGLLQMLDKLGKKVPFLLVMTHDESMKKRVPAKEEKVVVEEVLGRFSDSYSPESLKAESMVLRISRNEAGWDKEGLRLLCGRTKALLRKELWSAWAFITADIVVQLRKRLVRVLVLGEEKEEAEEFLREVTIRDGPNREFTLTTISTYPHPYHVTAKPDENLVDVIPADHDDASLPQQDREFGKGKGVPVAHTRDIINNNELDVLVRRLQVMKAEMTRGPAGGDETSTPFESNGDKGEEKLEMAVWECESSDSRIVFHQPLNINPLLDQDHMERAPIHPLDVRSPIRANLNLDCPTTANCAETWRKWLHEDGIHLCMLILRSKNSDMDTHTEAGLDRFLHRYYGRATHHYLKVDVGSPVPLLIVHSGHGEEVRKALATDLFQKVMNSREWWVQLDTFSWNKEDEAAKATAAREYLPKNVIHGCIAIPRTRAAFRCKMFATMSQMMRNVNYFNDSYNAWLLWNNNMMMAMVVFCIDLMRGTLGLDMLSHVWAIWRVPHKLKHMATLDLDTLCHIWRVPHKLKQVLKTLSKPNAVHEAYILCIIIFCKWKCNDEILSFEVEETTKYYMDMIDEALRECEDIHQRALDLLHLPIVMLEGLHLHDDKGKMLNQYVRENIIKCSFGDQIWHHIWNEWKHPWSYEGTMMALVLCKAYFEGGSTKTISSVKKVEVLFPSSEAMSSCIGVGVKSAIVLHNRGSRITHIVQEREFATVGERELEDMISKKGYFLMEMIIAATGKANNNGERQLYHSVEYGEHSEKRMPSPSEFHVQRDDEEGGHGVVRLGEWRKISHSPTTTVADAPVHISTTCTYISRVRVSLLAVDEVAIGDETSFIWGGSRSIQPRFEFTFRLQSGGCKERARSITIVSATQFFLLNGMKQERKHDNIQVTLGTRRSTSTLDVISNINWEDMIKSNKNWTPVQVPLSTDDRIVDRLTICDGFAVENLCDPHRAKFRLRHVSGKQKDVLSPGSYAAIRPRFQTVFLPSDNDAASPYTFEASRDLYSGGNDEEPHVQTYKVEFFVNHAMSHIRLSPENVEDREYVATNRPRFSFEEEEEEEEEEETDDLGQPASSDTDHDRLKVVVVGCEREDVETFLRAATNSDGPKRTFTSTSRERVSPKGDSEDDDELQLAMKETNKPFTYPTDALQIAEWESSESRILFHQLLNVNALFRELEEKDSMTTHPFNVHSHLRAQLEVDNIDEDMKLCILVVNKDSVGDPLQRFLYHYYSFHNISSSNSKVNNTCSLAPLLVARRRGFSQHERDSLRNSISSVLHHAYVPVLELPMHISLEEVSVCKYIQQNVIQGCKIIRPNGINRRAQQFQILQMMSNIIEDSHATQIFAKPLGHCLEQLPNTTESPHLLSTSRVFVMDPFPIFKESRKGMSNRSLREVLRRELRQFIHKHGNAHEHPQNDSTLLVLCNTSPSGNAAERSINAVELCFGSAEAMSRCIGVGVECAVVRHDSTTHEFSDMTLVHQVRGVEWLPTSEVTFETITEEGYLLLELVTYDGQSSIAGTDHDSHDGARARPQKDLLRMYGVAFEDDAGATYSFSKIDDEIETAIESSDTQEHGEEKKSDIQEHDGGKNDITLVAAQADEVVRAAEAHLHTVDNDKNEGRKEGNGYGRRNRSGESGGGGSSRSRNGSEDEIARGIGSKDRNGDKKSQDGGRDGRSGNGDGRGGGGGDGYGGDGSGGEGDDSQSQLYTKRVGVHLCPGGEFDTNNENHILLKNKHLLDISPQFKFRFDLQRRNNQGRITIESQTLFATDGNEEWYHDEIEVKIGNKEKIAASVDNDCFEQMIQNEVTLQQAQPKKLPTTTAEIEVKGSIGVAEAKACASRTWEGGHSLQTTTACDGFEISNLSGSHFARFRLNHIDHNPKKKKKNRTSLKGLQTTVCPKFKIAFIPRDHDPAAKYTFHASRMWAQMQEHGFLDLRFNPLRKGDPRSQAIQQSYGADFKLNHDLASLLGVWEHAENEEFVEPQLETRQFNYVALGSETLEYIL